MQITLASWGLSNIAAASGETNNRTIAITQPSMILNQNMEFKRLAERSCLCIMAETVPKSLNRAANPVTIEANVINPKSEDGSNRARITILKNCDPSLTTCESATHFTLVFSTAEETVTFFLPQSYKAKATRLHSQLYQRDTLAPAPTMRIYQLFCSFVSVLCFFVGFFLSAFV